MILKRNSQNPDYSQKCDFGVKVISPINKTARTCLEGQQSSHEVVHMYLETMAGLANNVCIIKIYHIL